VSGYRTPGGLGAAVFIAFLAVINPDPAVRAGGEEGRRCQGSVPEYLWTAPISGSSRALLLPRPDLPVRVSDRNLEAYDGDSGTLRWSLSADGAREVRIEDAGAFGLIVQQRFDRPPPVSGMTTGRSYRLRAIDPRTGAVLWDTDQVAGDCICIEALSEAGRLLLLVRSTDGGSALVALSLAEGDVIWETGLAPLPDVEFGIRPDPARWYVASNGILYRTDRREPTLSVAAIALESGDLQWVGYLAGEEAGSDLLLNSTGEVLCAAGENLYRLDRRSGAILWTFRGRWRPREVRSPWLLVQTAEGNRLQMVHVNTGEERWRSPARAAIPSAAPVIWSSEGVLSPEAGGGAALWSVSNGRSVENNRGGYRSLRGAQETIVAWDDGLLFVMQSPSGGTLLRLDARARQMWSVPLPASADGAPGPAVISHPGQDRGEGAIALAARGEGEGCELVLYDCSTGTELARDGLDPEAPYVVSDPGTRKFFYLTADAHLVAAGRR